MHLSTCPSCQAHACLWSASNRPSSKAFLQQRQHTAAASIPPCRQLPHVVHIATAAEAKLRAALLPMGAGNKDRPQQQSEPPAGNTQQQQQQQQQQQRRQQQQPPRKERDLVIPIAVAISLAAYALVGLLGFIDSLGS